MLSNPYETQYSGAKILNLLLLFRMLGLLFNVASVGCHDFAMIAQPRKLSTPIKMLPNSIVVQRRAIYCSRTALHSQHSKNIAIIGGGLAGLSTAYHLLDFNQSTPLEITIYDKSKVGEGGASAVAGGLLHPFSPKGKLIHLGYEALEHSKQLVQMATKYQPSCLIKQHLYRIALTATNVQQLQDSAEKYPEFATWLSKQEINNQLGADSMGGLKLSNGCQVIHVPLYLTALWEACEAKARECDGKIIWDEIQMNGDDSALLFESGHDTVIYSAGSGILRDGLIGDDSVLPVQLIRGQSIIMEMSQDFDVPKNEALLCGKYVTPLPMSLAERQMAHSKSKERFVIGATHEYSTKFSEDEVFNELKQRSYQFAPRLWDNGVVQKLTCGIRMQSTRGKYGRMPIVGRIPSSEGRRDNDNTWVFTGLSSRGLIYHGLFGHWLAEAVLHDDESMLSRHFAEFDWWKKNAK